MTNPSPENPLPLHSPVEEIETDPTKETLEDGVALCLSGGGYRAMLFHLGTLWRLNELGYLPKLDRVSSVSGGSITAAVLGLRWSKLQFANGIAGNFVSEVVAPIRALAGRTIDVSSILIGGLLPGVSISERVIAAYRKHLYGEATLQNLPDRPRFVINASNVQSGALWRFMKPYMRDYRVGEVLKPEVPLAVAVAASSAFPPFLSPLELDLNDSDFTPGTGQDLQKEPYTTQVVLTDGGVYDNLGLETAWKRYRTILVSDGGGKVAPEAEPKRDWARHLYRVLTLVDDQVRSLRKRQVIGSLVEKLRTGAYWGIRSHVSDYALPDPLPCPPDQTALLAGVPTRLERLEPVLQERLINWGYAICDTAMRRHVSPGAPKPAGFPYPEAGLG